MRRALASLGRGERSGRQAKRQILKTLLRSRRREMRTRRETRTKQNRPHARTFRRKGGKEGGNGGKGGATVSPPQLESWWRAFLTGREKKCIHADFEESMQFCGICILFLKELFSNKVVLRSNTWRKKNEGKWLLSRLLIAYFFSQNSLVKLRAARKRASVLVIWFCFFACGPFILFYDLPGWDGRLFSFFFFRKSEGRIFAASGPILHRKLTPSPPPLLVNSSWKTRQLVLVGACVLSSSLQKCRARPRDDLERARTLYVRTKCWKCKRVFQSCALLVKITRQSTLLPSITRRWTTRPLFHSHLYIVRTSDCNSFQPLYPFSNSAKPSWSNALLRRVWTKKNRRCSAFSVFLFVCFFLFSFCSIMGVWFHRNDTVDFYLFY